jgi:hypothetical protein
MRFIWENGEVYLRCTITPKVRIRTYDWADENKYVHVDAVGYIKVHADSYEANIYGTVSPAPPKRFDTLEEAKAYVEEQSLIGLAVNRLNV